MSPVEHIADAILDGRALDARSLVQSWIESVPELEKISAPVGTDPIRSSLVAGLVEMFADRLGQIPPEWTKQFGRAPRPVYLVQAALRMKRLRVLSETEGPLPLRKRGFFAPPDYLMAV